MSQSNLVSSFKYWDSVKSATTLAAFDDEFLYFMDEKKNIYSLTLVFNDTKFLKIIPSGLAVVFLQAVQLGLLTDSKVWAGQNRQK